MPLEIKKIYFKDCEIRKALISFSQLHRRYLELNDIKKMIVNKDNETLISLLVDQALEYDEDRICYSHAEVAAALLAFCMAVKIPVPKLGVKELHADKGEIYLKITCEQNVDFEQYVICDGLKRSAQAVY